MSLLKNCEKNSIARVAIAFIISFVVSTGISVANQPSAPEIDMPEDNFTDSGYIKIQWSERDKKTSAIYQLEQSDNPDFNNSKLIYEGPDRASFISGLPNGNYYFRVRRVLDSDVSDWSSTIRVRVKHHSLTMAFSLASVGIVVFLLTVGVVVDGLKKDKKS